MDAKQEDYKPTFTITGLSVSTVDDANTAELNPKQENMEENDKLLQQNGLARNEYRYQCDLCRMKTTTFKSVLEHRRSIHNIKRCRKRSIKHMDVEPDVYNRDLYCKSCEKSYSKPIQYRDHLRHVHYMILKPIRRTHKALSSNILPDPDDPNFYCKACDYTYNSKHYYKRHCRYTHGMIPEDQTSSSSSIIDSYCQICDIRLSNITTYRQHLFVIHNVNIKPARRQQSDIPPNVKDPNFYCRSCDKTMGCKSAFNRHLKMMHCIFESAPKRRRAKPNVDDPNHYCRACRRTYLNKHIYQVHLRLTHQMAFPLPKGKGLPNPYNQDGYCRVCRRTYSSFLKYRAHCKSVHFMVLDHASIVDPGATIDVNHPESYCAQCKRFYSHKKSFKVHLSRVHGI